MKRKKYEAPQLEFVDVELECVLLVGSVVSPGGNLPQDDNDDDLDFDIVNLILNHKI